MKHAALIAKNVIFEAHSEDSVIGIYESDRVLYSGCEFRNLLLIFRGGSKNALAGCLLRDCAVMSENEIQDIISGSNIMIDCKFNGEEIKDSRILLESFNPAPHPQIT